MDNVYDIREARPSLAAKFRVLIPLGLAAAALILVTGFYTVDSGKKLSMRWQAWTPWSPRA